MPSECASDCNTPHTKQALAGRCDSPKISRRSRHSRADAQGKASVICRASHSAVGCRVTSNHNSCRRPWPRTRKRKQAIKGQRRYNAHIDSGDRLSVILQKSLSSLRRRILTTHHVFRDRRLGDLEAKHQQLAMDPGCAPQRVFPAHLPDQNHAGHDRSAAALPYFGISNARTL
jgi:hypothetical protein